MNAISETEQEKQELSLKEWTPRTCYDQYQWSDKNDDLIQPLQEVGVDIRSTSKGVHVGTKSYVGHVAFEHFDLIVWPKFDHLGKDKPHESLLLKLLQYAFQWKHISLFAKRDVRKIFFADILVHELLKEAQSIQRRGLFQQYLRHHKELADLRGRIDMTAWFRRGGAPSATLPCVYHQRSFDNILNQTLCAGLRCGAEIAVIPKLKSQCRSLAHTFSLSVTEKRLDRSMLAEAQRGLNRLNAHYESAVQLIQLLYEGSGGFFHGDTLEKPVRIPGFFFDMNRLFEKVIEKFLKENLPDYTVNPQDPSKIYSYDDDEKNALIGKNLAASNPDIIVETPDKKERIVLDAKYKNIDLGSPGKGDLYQLSVYALACSLHSDVPVHRARIIYPADLEANDAEATKQLKLKPREVVLHRHDKNKNDSLCTITFQPVDMGELVGLIAEGNQDAKQQYARKLIGR